MAFNQVNMVYVYLLYVQCNFLHFVTVQGVIYLYRLLSGACTMLNHVIYYFTGDNTTYKVPEYFSYNENSFYDFECELDKYRLEQPTASSQNNT